MDKTTQNLLDLLQNAIYGKRNKVDIENPQKLLQMAANNGVVQLVYSQYKYQITDSELKETWRKQNMLYYKNYFRIYFVLNMVVKLLKANEIDYILLKGSHLNEIYPQPNMRSMGDIDILIREVDIEKAEEILTNDEEIELLSYGPVHDTYEAFGIAIEIHKCLKLKNQHKEFEILDHVFDYAIETNICETFSFYELVMPYELELIYLIFHIKKHLYNSGIGIRSIIDIGLYLEIYKDKIDKEKLNQYLIETKSKDFFDNLVLFYDRYMGADLEEFFLDNPVFDEELYETFTAYIIESGVHGLGVGFNRFISTFASNKNLNIGKSKSIIKIIFPSYIVMKGNYPKLLKHKIFLPIGWFLRILRVIFKKPKSTITKLKKINQSKAEKIEEVSDLYKKMGI